MILLMSADFFSKLTFSKNYQNVKLYGSRSGWTFWVKLFVKVISRRQKSRLARKEVGVGRRELSICCGQINTVFLACTNPI